MGAPSSRRGFLHGLAALPLIGGSVALIGAPTAVAEPVTRELLESYDAWLEYERRWLQYERHGARELPHRLSLPFAAQMAGWDEYDMVPHANGGANFHRSKGPSATSRAALVLGTLDGVRGQSGHAVQYRLQLRIGGRASGFRIKDTMGHENRVLCFVPGVPRGYDLIRSELAPPATVRPQASDQGDHATLPRPAGQDA